MSRSPFGWGYPAGAENDPNAPYNQPDYPDACPICGAENSDADVDVFPCCSEECAAAYEEKMYGPEPDDDPPDDVISGWGRGRR